MSTVMNCCSTPLRDDENLTTSAGIRGSLFQCRIATIRKHTPCSTAEVGSRLKEPNVHIGRLAKRFLGVDKYPYRQPTEKRLIVRTELDQISDMGPRYGN